MSKPKEALQYLKEALKVEEDQLTIDPQKFDSTEHAGTHLNICAILS